jgi:hypothetical protein
LTRYLPALLVLVLLAATGLAFVYAESLKLEPSPITSTRVDRLVSPVCDCATGRARIAFKLRKKDVLTVSILDSGGREVRRIATERPVPAKQEVSFFWNGRVAGRKPAPDGVYHAQVRLELLEKTITLPNQIRVDATPPRATITSARPRTISPDGDRRSDYVSVGYTVDEPAQVELRVDGVKRVLGNGVHRRGQLKWYGRIDGTTMPAGTYRLRLVAIDEAGNRSRPSRAVLVRVRYIQLFRDSVVVRPLGLVRTLVFTDAASYTWRLAGRSGTTHAKRLVVRAPARPGSYALFVETHGHADRMSVVVRRRPR